MSYPVVILGAGAAFDHSSIPSSKRPPLTDDLIKPEFLNAAIAKRYTGAGSLLSEIAPLVNQREQSLEECLTLKRNEAHKSKYKQEQLVALQYYLRDLFEQISLRYYQDFNNYKALVSKINTHWQGQACVVNFNYDTFFEKSIEGDSYENINSYIKNNLKIIKVHGSHDWAYIDDPEKLDFKFSGFSDDVEFLQKNPDYLERLREKGAHPYHIKELKGKNCVRFPSIAIPLFEKQDFVCPNNHIEFLRRALSETVCMLIIGWRAGDKKFIEIMEESIKKPVSVTVVTGGDNKKEFEEEFLKIKDNLKKVTNLVVNRKHFTFRTFVASKTCEEFFSYYQ